MRQPAVRNGIALAAAAAVFYGFTFLGVFPMVDALWPSRTLARVVDGLQGCDVKPVAITGYAEPSAVFYLGTATGLGDADDAAELLRRDPECGIAVRSEEPTSELQ